MSRFLIDDATKTDPRAALDVVKMALLTDIVAPLPQYMKVEGDASLSIVGDCIISTYGGGVFKTTAQIINASNLDTGAAFVVGKDYYVYICDLGNKQDEKYVVSLNSTYPSGYTASNSRKIGGFHYGKCRRVNAAMQPVNASGIVRGIGWESTVYDGIIPRSVWTLQHRPKCSPEGMTYISAGLWADIYLNSDDGAGGLKSAYSGTPITGTEGLNFYDFVERLAAVGKKLPTYDEWCAAALGSPQGNNADNNNAWSANTNTGRQAAGYVANAVSSFGLRDCAGNVWEHTSTLITNAEPAVITGNGTFGSWDGNRGGKNYTGGNGHGTTGAWGWDTTSPFEGYGNIFEYHDYSLIRLFAGGGWGDGSGCGARAVDLGDSAWNVIASIGGRGVCDAL